MSLLTITKEQETELRGRLVGWARESRESGRSIDTVEAHRALFSALEEMGVGSPPQPGFRAPKPNYRSLGMNRKAGQPTKEEKALYSRVTNGAVLPDNSLVCMVLMNDSDLITDRFMVKTTRALNDMRNHYVGRRNDFDHSFKVRDAKGVIIHTAMGTDPKLALHPMRPTESLIRLSPNDPHSEQYLAMWALMAFPEIAGDNTIERIQLGLISDVSIAAAGMRNQTLCSFCLKPMRQGMCYSYCPQHGFPGGVYLAPQDPDSQDEKDKIAQMSADEKLAKGGRLICTLLNGVEDCMTLGLVSDGAVSRAQLVLDPDALTGGSET